MTTEPLARPTAERTFVPDSATPKERVAPPNDVPPPLAIADAARSRRRHPWGVRVGGGMVLDPSQLLPAGTATPAEVAPTFLGVGLVEVDVQAIDHLAVYASAIGAVGPLPHVPQFRLEGAPPLGTYTTSTMAVAIGARAEASWGPLRAFGSVGGGARWLQVFFPRFVVWDLSPVADVGAGVALRGGPWELVLDARLLMASFNAQRLPLLSIREPLPVPQRQLHLLPSVRYVFR